MLRCPVPIAVVGLEPIAARSFGIGPEGALLVRPDGQAVAGWWHAVGAREELCRAVTSFVALERPLDSAA
jgi:hypothetical protein